MPDHEYKKLLEEQKEKIGVVDSRILGARDDITTIRTMVVSSRTMLFVLWLILVVLIWVWR